MGPADKLFLIKSSISVSPFLPPSLFSLSLPPSLPALPLTKSLGTCGVFWEDSAERRNTMEPIACIAKAEPCACVCVCARSFFFRPHARKYIRGCMDASAETFVDVCASLSMYPCTHTQARTGKNTHASACVHMRLQLNLIPSLQEGPTRWPAAAGAYWC